MATQAINLEARANSLKAVLSNRAQKHSVDEALQTANGDWGATLKRLQEKLPAAALQKVALANDLAEWSGDNVSLVKSLANEPNVASLRDVALNFDVEKLAELVQSNGVPADTPGATPQEKARNLAGGLNNKLFVSETSAVLQRMLQEAEIPIADTTLRTGVATFLNNQPDFNIRTTPVYTAFKQPAAFKDIPVDQRGEVIEQLKTLQRVQAISPVPEAVPALMNANLTSAFNVAEKPESTFLKAFSGTLGEETARQLYTNAINVHIGRVLRIAWIGEVARQQSRLRLGRVGEDSEQHIVEEIQRLLADAVDGLRPVRTGALRRRISRIGCTATSIGSEN